MFHFVCQCFVNPSLASLPRHAPAPAPDPQISTPENPQIWPIDRSPMFTEVIDVGMKPKSPIFPHVHTAPAEEKAAGGRNWAG
jgi:hypothetical protein